MNLCQHCAAKLGIRGTGRALRAPATPGTVPAHPVVGGATVPPCDACAKHDADEEFDIQTVVAALVRIAPERS